jgi:regulator of sigma E protease
VTPTLDERDAIGIAGWRPTSEVQVATVADGMEAQKKGLQVGDVLVRIGGQPIRSGATVPDLIQRSGGEPVEITFRRDGQEHDVVLKPERKEMEGKQTWLIGVGLEPRREFIRLSFPQAVRASVDENIQNAGLIYRMLKGIIEQRMSPKSIEGPIRIAQFSGEAAERGPVAYLLLMSLVSLNLAVFNLLPIPVLDGGLIFMLLIEMVFRRDLSLQVKENFMKFGFVFLMMVVMFVIYNDVRKTIGG